LAREVPESPSNVDLPGPASHRAGAPEEGNMLPTDRYYDFEDTVDTPGTPGTTSTSEFLLRCLLGARGEAGFPSNEQGFDEDVNVYLVGLLGRFLSSAHHEEVLRYSYASDLDLSREARAGDERFRYRAYRTNADRLLLEIGLFQRVDRPRPHMPHLEREPREFIGRGETYYGIASSSLRRLRRRSTGTEVAMQKLSGHFGDYARVLGRLRTSYFHLTARLGDGQLFHLMNDPLEGDTSEVYDRFLDAYSAWKTDPTEETLETLVARAGAVRRVDPDFAFDLPEIEED